MVRNRMLRVEDDIWELFLKVANEEGRFLGKTLEILLQNHVLRKEELNDNNRHESCYKEI